MKGLLPGHLTGKERNRPGLEQMSLLSGSENIMKAGGFAAARPAVRRRPGLATRSHDGLIRLFFSILAVVCDFSAVVVSAAAAGWVYHHLFFGAVTPINSLLVQGSIIAILFIMAGLVRGDYALNRYLLFSGHITRIFLFWTMALFLAVLLAFLTKTSDDASRGTAILFYLGGFAFVVLVRFVLVRIVRSQAEAGNISNRRIFLIGFEENVSGFLKRHKPSMQGIDVVAAAIIREPQSLADDLALAAASARVLRPEDIFILAPLTQRAAIEACLGALQKVPASVHLSPEEAFEGLADFQFGRIGSIQSLSLVRKPLTAFEIFQKRMFDIAASGVALLLLSPLFLLVALAIKLDSRGPVFFAQRRYGFNQEPFRIYKFRSMTTMEDGRIITQVTKGDSRVTRVGRFIRRTNFDELPQLLNVLRGDMSLVGPRPHAMAHDQFFNRKIANYARRHNVKPGITGWAQVNGLRGETNTDDKMRARVEHDLYYIYKWSMWLDLRICLLTVFSRKSYDNAL
jgi:Undecaprenyl-phosphate glucose phosphotransferase